MKVKLTYTYNGVAVILTHRVLTLDTARSTSEQFRIASHACPSEYDSFWLERKADYDKTCKALESVLATPVTYENWPFKSFELSAADKMDFVHQVRSSIDPALLFEEQHPNRLFVAPQHFSAGNVFNGDYLVDEIRSPTFNLTHVEVIDES